LYSKFDVVIANCSIIIIKNNSILIIAAPTKIQCSVYMKKYDYELVCPMNIYNIRINE